MVAARKKKSKKQKKPGKMQGEKKKEKKGTAEGFFSDDITPVDKTPISYLQQQKVAQEALLQGLGMLHSKSSLEK